MKKIILFIIPFLLLSLPSQGQKMKYKDLFPILDAKNYEEGIPTLNAFLKISKYADHPNANLQKALYFESLVDSYALLADSSNLLVHTDSAVIYFSKTKPLITEKELKKKKDYYKVFNRRDLRTGEFGVKISDVHLDIETRIQSLRKLNKNAKIIYQNLAVANADYKTSNELFRRYSTSVVSQEEFLLKATEEDLTALDDFMDRGDIIEKAFEDIRQSVSVIRIKGYSPELILNPIKDFINDGRTTTDMYGIDVNIWDYSSWAEEAKRTIKRDISRMRDQLKREYDVLKMKNDKVKSGGGITENDISSLLNETLVSTLHKYDNSPLPEYLLNMLVNDTKIKFMTNATLNPLYGSEDDVNYHLKLSDSINNMISDVNSQLELITEKTITDAILKYPSFLKNNYGGDFGLLKYKEKTQKRFDTAQEKWSVKYEFWKTKNKWGVSEDLADSIYLIGKSDSLYESIPLSKYYTISVTSDDSAYVYAVGIEFTGDKDKGFLARIGKDRTIQWKENFDLGKFQYSDSAILVMGEYIPTEEGKISMYIYSYVPNTPTNIIILNADKTGTINWTNEISILRSPITTKFNDDVKETYIYYIGEEELATYEGEGSGYIVIDRRGKIR